MARLSLRRHVAAPPCRVLAVLADREGLARACPGRFRSARMLSARGGTSVSEERLLLGGREIVVTARHTVLGTGGIETRVIGGSMKGSTFRYSVAAAPGGSEVRAEILLRLGLRGVLGAGRYGRDCAAMLGCLAGAAESSPSSQSP